MSGQYDSDIIIYAKDIDDCSNCPLYQHDCVGGWTSGGGGTPIEPPCCSSNGDEEIYEGMYEYNTYDPSERELASEREFIEQKERELKETRELKDKIDAKQRVYNISKYGNAKIKSNGELCFSWYCPKCQRWFHGSYESWSGGIGETSCNYCGERLAYSSLLDK